MSPDATDLRILVARRNRILAKLSVLSDGNAGTALRGDTVGGSPNGGDSIIPPGVRLDSEGAPSKRLSLYAHYKWRFERASTVPELYRLCAMAERDYLDHTGEGHTTRYDTEAARRLLLSEWSGWHSAEVAVWENRDERWVRRHRIAAGLDPDYGDQPDPDERRSRVIRMQASGASQRAIANDLGLSQGRVSQILSAA